MNNNKILLCSINSKYVHSSLAVWCLLAGTKKYSKLVMDCTVEEYTINNDISFIVKEICSKPYSILCFSCYIWNIATIKKLLPLLKEKLPNATIVLGGPEVSYNIEAVFESMPCVDYIISGEGEYPIAKLLEKLYTNDKVEPLSIDGVSMRLNNGLCIAPSHISHDEPPSPYCKEYFEMLKGRISYIEASRGCPYSCAFCLSSRCGGVRYFDFERTKKEILALANSGSTTIKFVDRTFNANKKRSGDIINFIKENYGNNIPKGVCFHFEIAGDILDNESIALLGSLPKGLVQLEIGMQSFNEKTLEAINRKTDCKKLIENILKLTAFNNMHIHIDLIAGLPFEGLESFRESFNIAYSLKAQMLQLGFLKVLYGTPMADFPDKYPANYSKNAPYEVTSTTWLSPNDIELLKAIEDSNERLYNSGRFKKTLDYAIEASGLSPFDFMLYIGKQLYPCHGISLDDYTDKLMLCLKNLKSIDPFMLRDNMLIDRISTNPSGKIPKSLMVADKRLKKVKLMLEQDVLTAKKPNIKRFVGLLYSTNKAVYVDYDNNKKADYKLNYLDLAQLEDTNEKR